MHSRQSHLHAWEVQSSVGSVTISPSLQENRSHNAAVKRLGFEYASIQSRLDEAPQQRGHAVGRAYNKWMNMFI